MKNNNKWKVLKELFIHDFIIGSCFWSFLLLLIIPLFKLPQSLAMAFYVFFAAVGLICLPFSLYRISSAIYLAQKGVQINATNVSVELAAFGRRVKFKYEYDGQTYHKVKYYQSVFFTEKDWLKLLVDPKNPEKFIIFEFKKKSVLSVVREKNK